MTVRPVETLYSLVQKSAPGRSPDFTPAHLLMALKIIERDQVGRKQLAEHLDLGEGTVRNLIGRLVEEGLISSSRRGMSLTEMGGEFLSTIKSKLIETQFKANGITVANYNYLVLVRGASNMIRYGVEQRDAAIIAGAKGATTLLITCDGLVMPGMNNSVEKGIFKKIMSLNPVEGDVIIIGSADSPLYAKMGTYAAALELLV